MYVCISVCMYVSKLLLDHWADLPNIWRKDASQARLTYKLYFMTLGQRSRSLDASKFDLFVYASWKVLGGSNILHCCLSHVADRGEGIHTWAASVLETEVVGDSHFNYKESRKQMVFWDTILCSGHCVDFKDYLPPKKK